MKNEIWIAGFPSLFGGADTELDHNLDLFRQKDVEVNIVPTYEPVDEAMRRLVLQRGFSIHQYHPSIFKDKVVTAWCNGDFLPLLPEIYEAGKPKAVVWFNCMTWAFRDELEAHKNEFITHFGFVSAYQQKLLTPQLEKIGPVNVFEGYKPFYSLNNHSQSIRFCYRQPKDWYAVGRVSRDDPAKYSADMWSIFNRVIAPLPTKTFILGFGDKVAEKVGLPPADMDWQWWTPNGIPVAKMYQKLHCLIHKTGGSRESYCRVVAEGFAAGVPVVVENDYAFPSLIEDGVTGFLCQSSAEMSFRASELAFDEPKRKAMVYAAKEYLDNEQANPDKCWQTWAKLFADCR